MLKTVEQWYKFDTAQMFETVEQSTESSKYKWSGAADFPCLRQLPPPPKRAPAQKGSDVEKDDKHKKKNKANAKETKTNKK